MTAHNLQFLYQSENRDTFFRRIHMFILPYHKGASAVADAYKAAKEGHHGSKRSRGERYFEHCRAVAIILIDIVGVRDWETIAAALLHDHIEDCHGWTKARIQKKWGVGVAGLVAAVSMPEGDFPDRDSRMAAYHAQFLAAIDGGDLRALRVKLADRLHNLSSCESVSYERQWRMVNETEEFYLPLSKKHGILYRELSDMIAFIKDRLPSRVS
jgi:(p)ppGpp synthase/HD superfamily hydrolase